LSAAEQALVSFEDNELGDHGVEAGGAVHTAQLLNGRIVCSVIQAAVQDRTALLSARFAPPLQRVGDFFLPTPFCLSPLLFLPLHFLLAL